MLNRSDLNDAVGEGIISREQAEQLTLFAKRIRSTEDNPLFQELETRDEPFRLLRGFRDVFVMLGVLFLAIGVTSAGYYFGNFPTQALSYFSSRGFSEQIDFSSTNALITVVWVLIGFVLSEIITKRLRLPLASLVLSLAIMVWGGLFVLTFLGGPILEAITGTRLIVGRGTEVSEPKSVVLAIFSVGAFASLVLYYIRYRLPFVFLLIAGSIIAFLLSAVNVLATDFVRDNIRVLIGLTGIGVFALAMTFDLQDRFRVTRYSECAFWLHLLAAPLIIHALLAGKSTDAGVIFGVFAILVLIALVIDRRAFLVSALSYLIVAFVQVVNALDLDSTARFFVPMVVIGFVVVLLGIGWTPLRRLVVMGIPSVALRDYLPPVANTLAPDKKAINS